MKSFSVAALLAFQAVALKVENDRSQTPSSITDIDVDVTELVQVNSDFDEVQVDSDDDLVSSDFDDDQVSSDSHDVNTLAQMGVSAEATRIRPGVRKHRRKRVKDEVDVAGLADILAGQADPDFTNFCWIHMRKRKHRGSIDTCPANTRLDVPGLCFHNCPSGYDAAGPTCMQKCPAPLSDGGPFCGKPGSYTRRSKWLGPWDRTPHGWDRIGL